MLLTRLLNACHHFPGFVYEGARLRQDRNLIEVNVRPRQGSKPRCSGCQRPAGRAAVRVHPEYGFRTFRILELALYHTLGKLPEPQLAHRFF